MSAVEEVCGGVPEGAPRTLYSEEGEVFFETRGAYAKPAEASDVAALNDLEKLMRVRLPDDFREFYSRYASGLLITQSLPIHLFPIGEMLRLISAMRESYEAPLRFVRIAQYREDVLQFGLWNRTGADGGWQVISTSVNYLDDHYDAENVPDALFVGSSFGDWIVETYNTDGRGDPLELRYNGGALFVPL